MIRATFQKQKLPSVHLLLFIIAYQSGITVTNLSRITFKMILTKKNVYIIRDVFLLYRLVLKQKHQDMNQFDNKE